MTASVMDIKLNKGAKHYLSKAESPAAIGLSIGQNRKKAGMQEFSAGALSLRANPKKTPYDKHAIKAEVCVCVCASGVRNNSA